MTSLFGAANRVYWDNKARFNIATWDIEAFVADRAKLSQMVAADREALGDARGRSLLHLQCHFGMDTLAWARLGAEVTGVDFSTETIAAARDLAARAGLAARFVETDLYAVPEVLEETFEIVYTGGASSAGCPTSGAGARWSAGCCGQAARSTSAKPIPCCGRWRTSATMRRW